MAFFEIVQNAALDSKESACMQETWVLSPRQEDPLEKGMAIHSRNLAWKIPWTEMGYSPWGHKKSDTTEQISLSKSR